MDDLIVINTEFGTHAMSRENWLNILKKLPEQIEKGLANPEIFGEK